MSEFIHGDCLKYMRKMPDNAYDLAIVDPPYGSGFTIGGGCKGWFTKYHQPLRATLREVQTPARTMEYHGGVSREIPTRKRVARTGGATKKWRSNAVYGKKIIAWDIAPGKEYFDELFRVSRNQIIWGGNYFDLPPCRCFVIFRKTNIPIKGFTMSPVEYAWTSFNRNAVMIEAFSNGTAKEPRFHPTQKPVVLYEELLMQFAKKGDKILDTHAGSGSSLIACYNLGYEYTGFEIDDIYYEKACKRIEEVQAQIRMEIDI